mmetsp:Transcript_40552/g.96352  ORF Transcript_40552/g.96352 Transcript_40552/m.96352 type:complete len:308 (-) Transcript_40552:54-977(-)
MRYHEQLSHPPRSGSGCPFPPVWNGRIYKLPLVQQSGGLPNGGNGKQNTRPNPSRKTPPPKKYVARLVLKARLAVQPASPRLLHRRRLGVHMSLLGALPPPARPPGEDLRLQRAPRLGPEPSGGGAEERLQVHLLRFLVLARLQDHLQLVKVLDEDRLRRLARLVLVEELLYLRGDCCVVPEHSLDLLEGVRLLLLADACHWWDVADDGLSKIVDKRHLNAPFPVYLSWTCNERHYSHSVHMISNTLGLRNFVSDPAGALRGLQRLRKKEKVQNALRRGFLPHIQQFCSSLILHTATMFNPAFRRKA